MPITRRQFELGIDNRVNELMIKVYELLESNRDQAYSLAEILENLRLTPAIYADLLGIAIKTLRRIGAIEVSEVADVNYYAFRQAVHKDTWALEKEEENIPF
ncbi:MAG: hypothetical protein A3D89_04605 [Planctomycetes bacterium RIFCSPHIGHO2_02_FULL_52_58]|nr:MAG: hypothetical protein A3D89_04605 [Planctomycetes bacterium RIFCSPHIGHO2_02_FULL_52_58]